MDENEARLQRAIEKLINQSPTEKQYSLRKLFQDAREVSLHGLAFRLTKEGESEKEIYKKMVQEIEANGIRFSTRSLIERR